MAYQDNPLMSAEWNQQERLHRERHEWHKESLAQFDKDRKKWNRFTYVVFGLRPLIELAILITLLVKF